MNHRISLRLTPNASQNERLLALQKAFAEVCNALAPMAQKTACWNRVALHHMAYKTLRQQFPDLGSQMVCNAIYSVSRSCRLVYQHPKSPFNLQRLDGRPLPLVYFLPQSPVYFDRHTLSLKDGQVSMFTLDGRMRFRLALSPEDEARFRNDKLREIVLDSPGGHFTLSFNFAPAEDDGQAPTQEASSELPEYMLVVEGDVPPLPLPARRPLHISPTP
jgi:hypothetical protein